MRAATTPSDGTEDSVRTGRQWSVGITLMAIAGLTTALSIVDTIHVAYAPAN